MNSEFFVWFGVAVGSGFGLFSWGLQVGEMDCELVPAVVFYIFMERCIYFFFLVLRSALFV